MFACYGTNHCRVCFTPVYSFRIFGYRFGRSQLVAVDRQADVYKRQDKNSGNSDKQLVQYVFQVLYESEDIESAVNLILKIVGKKMNVSLAYIFEDSEDGRYCSNTFEWCNDDIEPEIHQLQNVSHADTKYYYNNFDENGILYCQNIKQLPAAQREVLEIQGIKALLQCAIRDKMEIKGFVGFDDCNVERFWTQEQIDVLMLISEILSVFLLKQRAQERMEKSVERMRAILDSQNSFICVLDCNTFELLYICLLYTSRCV